MKKAELVFIPSPGMGHIVSTVEMAKLLINRDDRLSITVLIMTLPFESNVSSYTQSLSTIKAAAADPPQPERIRFVYLAQDESKADLFLSSPLTALRDFIDWHKTHVRQVVSEMISNNYVITGFVVDMFCTPMIDVANEFGVPTFVFLTSSAAFLGLILHIQTLLDHHNQDITELNIDDDHELYVPTFVNPLPIKVLPSVVLDKEVGSTMFLDMARRFRQTKGIIVNTFTEFESHAVNSLSNDDKIPPVYPVGPVINLTTQTQSASDDTSSKMIMIMTWLDNQPPCSVVYVCFGSTGSFGADQVREIADALERSGHRFLWSLRRPPTKGNLELPGDYDDPRQVLPEGFLERTAEMGKVIGWAPQVAVLSHPAVGGFVSHCGWNSTLESLWFGVPVATWPLSAEQQMNAFQMVREFGLSVEIKLDYRKEFGIENQTTEIVTAEEIESGIRKLMDADDDQCKSIKKKVKEMSKMSRIAVAEGGSSYNALGRLIKSVI